MHPAWYIAYKIMPAKKIKQKKNRRVVVIAIGIAIILSIGSTLTTLSKPSVVETLDSSATPPGKEELLAYYQSFIEKARDFSHVITEEELQREIQDAQQYMLDHPEGLHTDDIQKTIIEKLNISFLLDGIEKRPLTVTTIATHQRDGYIEKELLLKDEWIDQTEIHLLIPDKQYTKQYPAVIGLHGHADSATVFRDKYFGAELARAGFVVLIPAVQALEHPDIDEEVSKKMYLNGFSLMGVRAYKVLLFTKYLQYLKEVDNKRIGLMGHSGGSTTVMLVAHLRPKNFNGLVYDLDGTYLDMWAEDPHIIHCDTIPRFSYYRKHIHKVSNLPFPSKEFEYGYHGADDKDKIIQFFQSLAHK